MLFFHRPLVGFSQNPDDAEAALQNGFFASDDDGATFARATGLDGPGGMNLARLADGNLLDVGFKSPALGARSVDLVVYRSDDDGHTWRTEAGRLDAPADLVGLRTHRGLLRLPDGRLLVPAYLTFRGEPSHGVRLLEGDASGSTWGVRSTLLAPAAGWDFNEAAIAFTADGELIAVVRAHDDETLSNLKEVRSADLGQTWSAPVDLSVAFEREAPTARVGVDPALLLMPNGVLVLSAGRPDNWIAIRPPGQDHWSNAGVTYVNHPTTPQGASRNHGSSGYTGLAPLGSNRRLLSGDNCANSWGCPAREGGWTVDGRSRIWRAFVDVLTPDVGKLDLRGGASRCGALWLTRSAPSTAASPSSLPPRRPGRASSSSASIASAQ